LREFRAPEFDAPVNVFVLIGGYDDDIPLTQDQVRSAEKAGWLVYKIGKGFRLVKTTDPKVLFYAGASVKSSFERWTINAIQEGYAMLSDTSLGSSQGANARGARITGI
jgi:hypothetical protein